MAGFESRIVCGRNPVTGQPEVINSLSGRLQVDTTFSLPINVWMTVTGTFAVAGDNQIVAAPGANQAIEVKAFCIQCESATATTMILRSGASANGWRCLAQNQGDGLAMVFPVSDPWRCTANEALNLNLSGANQCNYSLSYRIAPA